MRIHILGICGTFMSGLAVLAKQLGFEVTGSDQNIYPPMSDQLKALGVTLIEGYDTNPIIDQADCVIVGNVMRRGHPIIESILSNQIFYQSGPEWLYQHVLKKRFVLAVAGTHGKTTTSSMLAFILEEAGLNPGFLIGGMPENFGVSARLGAPPFFVIEADEYDSAFFDKRSKFIHYRPKTLILNNLEYDHADIFPDLNAIKQQFHYLIRTIPENGCIIYPKEDTNLQDVLNLGTFSPMRTIGETESANWSVRSKSLDNNYFDVFFKNEKAGEIRWKLLGKHNAMNALAAIAAASHVGVSPEAACKSLSRFMPVKRRLEIKKQLHDLIIYDDFAHHPTAIQTTLNGLRAKIGKQARIVAVVEFASYTMRSGVHKDRLQAAFYDADLIFCKNTQTDWGLRSVLDQFKQRTGLYDDVDTLIKNLVPSLQSGDHVVIMSNGGFGNIHQKLIDVLEKDDKFNASQ